MSIPSPEDSYDWTFSYKLSKPVYCRQSKDDSTILFEKDSNNNLTGFKIKVNNKTDSEATEINKMKTKKLEQVLTILSGMELIAIPAGREGIPRKPGLRRVHNTLVVKYDIEGSIDKVDITDPNIVSLIKDKENPVLGYLSNAVAHKSHGRYSESIKEAFSLVYSCQTLLMGIGYRFMDVSLNIFLGLFP